MKAPACLGSLVVILLKCERACCKFLRIVFPLFNLRNTEEWEDIKYPFGVRDRSSHMKNFPMRRSQRAERSVSWCPVMTARDGNTGLGAPHWRPFCVWVTGNLVQNKAFLSSTQKCGCLCHFNWSVFVKWGLYLLIAWGLCLPSLVEAKWRGSGKLSCCILRHFSFQYLCLSNSWASVKQAQEGTRPTGRNYT